MIRVNQKSQPSRTSLTASEKRILADLQRLPSNGPSRCAAQLNEEYSRCHRGAISLRGHKLVYGNDGFTLDDPDDIRAKVEVVQVVRTIDRINAHWKYPVFEVNGFGLSDDGYTWALRVETGYFDWSGVLDTAVWDAWFRACGKVTGNNGHPCPNRLREEVRSMFIPAPTASRRT